MIIVVDLRNSFGKNGKVTGGGIHCIKQFELLRHLNPVLLVNSEKDCAILKYEGEILTTLNAKIFFKKNQGIFVSGLPYDIYKFPLENWNLFITIHSLRYLDEPHDWFEPFYSTSLNQLYISIFKTTLPFIYKQFRLHQYSQLIDIKCNSIKILTDSLTSKSLIKFYFPKVKVEVLYPFSDLSDSIQSDFKSPSKKYILMLNSERWVKNYIRAFSALKLYNKKTGNNLQMIATGKPNWFMRYFYSNNVHFTGYLKEEELNALVKHSTALIYPSLSEGFGYPPMRALYMGKTVYASNLPVLNEIYGKSLIFFNPQIVKDISRALLINTTTENGILQFQKINKIQENDAIKFKEMIEKACQIKE